MSGRSTPTGNAAIPGDRRRRLPLVLFIAVVIGAVLRTWNLGFGLPAIYNPDEVAIMNRAVALGQNGLNPGNFLYPSLYFYALFAWEGVWYLVGRASGVFGSLADFERAYFLDPSSIYIAGRLLSVLAGVATIWATWRLAGRLFGPMAAGLAAVLLAVAPLAVRDAHYVKHDVPVTLLIVLAMYAAVTAAETARWKHWLAAGVLAGLAFSTHYYAVFVVATVAALAWAAIIKRGGTQRMALAVAGLVVIGAAGAFVLTSPFLLPEWRTAWRDITANREIVMDRATSSGGWLASLGYYGRWLLTDSLGLVSGMLALAGLGLALRAGIVASLATLAFPVAFLLFIANTVPASRYLNPVLPFAAILAGLAVDRAAQRGPRLRMMAMSVAAAAIASGATASFGAASFFGQADTRTQAREWIEREIPQGASVLVQPYSVPLHQSRAALDEALAHHLGDPARASVKFQRQRSLDPYPAPAYRLVYLGRGGLDVDRLYIDPAAFDGSAGLAPLRAAAVTYVVLKRYNVPDPAMAALSRALNDEARLVASFYPYRPDATPEARAATPPFLHNTDVRIAAVLERPGPIVEIWRLD